MSVQMGSYQNLNDPREAKSWNFAFYARSKEVINSFEPQELFLDISNYITQKTLVLCCSRDDPNTSETDTNRYIRSGYGHPRMWSQYADGHKGVCIVFDHNELHESIVGTVGSKGLYCGSVNYLETTTAPSDDHAYHIKYVDDILKNGISSVMDSHIHKYNENLFFTKHIDWRDECEHRWIFRSNDNKPILIPINNCIRGIILGNDFNSDDTSEILKLCADIGIEVYKLLQHGWSMSLMPLSQDEEAISLEGISYSTDIPCEGVFTQAHNVAGSVVPIFINDDGEVTIVS